MNCKDCNEKIKRELFVKNNGLCFICKEIEDLITK